MSKPCCPNCLIHLPYKERNEYQCNNRECECHTPKTFEEKIGVVTDTSMKPGEWQSIGGQIRSNPSAPKEEKLPCGHTEAEHLESGCVGHFEEEEWEKEFDECFATDYDLAYVAQIKYFIKSRFFPKERVEKALEENRNETLWGDEDSNEVMKVSIDEYIAAVRTELSLLSEDK